MRYKYERVRFVIKISKLIFGSWLMIGVFSCGIDAYTASEVDIQMLKLHFLMTIGSNCTQGEQGVYREPLCATMAAFVRQLDYLIIHRKIALTELLVSVITQLNDEGPVIKDALRHSHENIIVGKNSSGDTDLLDFIKDVEGKLKQNGLTKELIERYEKLMQRHQERLQQQKA